MPKPFQFPDAVLTPLALHFFIHTPKFDGQDNTPERCPVITPDASLVYNEIHFQLPEPNDIHDYFTVSFTQNKGIYLLIDPVHIHIEIQRKVELRLLSILPVFHIINEDLRSFHALLI